VNHYWRHAVIKRRVIVYVSGEGKAYRQIVQAAVMERWPKLCKPLANRLHVVVAVNPPDRRARDLDNLGKGLLDSLKHAGVYRDDSLIDHLEYVRSEQVGKPGSVDVQLQLFSSQRVKH
jgi:crossover junction endodeoxyribonuclease RusA